VFEKMVLRRMSGPVNDKNVGNDQVMEDEMVRACSMHGEKKNAHGVLVGKPEQKRPLRSPRYVW
jgi:hypothetical protein